MGSFNLIIQPVLEKELYTTPPLMPVVVAKIIGSRKEIPRAFRLTKDLSTVELKHLRRIRDLESNEIECIICRSKTNGNPNDELKNLEVKFASEGIFQDYRIAQVPSSAPQTDHQLKACTEIWPCKFAKSNYLIQCIEGAVFSEAEKLVLRIIVNSIVNYIKVDHHESYNTGAVIFRCAKIYGIGFSNPELIVGNPLKHSTMNCIDSVATNAGAGHWKCSEKDELLNSIQEKLDNQKELEDHRIDAKFLPYLCTNYDIFVTEEPCIMCTMGLVQSRIRRLFYLDSNSVEMLKNCQQLCYPDKAIEEFLIHRDKSLNHRFEAWRISLSFEDE